MPRARWLRTATGLPPAPGRVAGLPPAPGRVAALSTTEAVGVAVAAWVGALVAAPLPRWVALVVLVAAVGARRPRWLVVAALLGASGLAALAHAGMVAPPADRVEGVATLVSDPVTRFGRVEAVVRWDGRLLLLRAEGPAGEVAGARLAGERVTVVGRIGPLPVRSGALRIRHVVARLDVREATAGGEASVPWRAANTLRRTLVDGADHLGDDRRALYAGLLLGDDRDQTPETVDDFRGSGLAHLLAVSGQNVAFVAALAGPALRRLGLRGRVIAIVVVLTGFAFVTRFEPSVLRAVAMAGAAAVATAWGRPTPAVHLCALSVAGLVLVDPFLVRSLGFQLSVAATAGILVFGPRLAGLLPGPPSVAAVLAVGWAAQAGVAPLLVAGFDGVPVASLPTNVVAGPLAGFVMTWGLPAGLVAGLVGGPLAVVLHAPTGVALDALAVVARAGASVPLGDLGAGHLVVLAGCAVVAGVATRPRRPAVARATASGGAATAVVASAAAVGGAAVGSRRGPARPLAAVVALAALAAPGVALARAPAHVEPETGVDVWRAGGATVVAVAPGTGPTAVLEGLRRAGVTRVDLLLVGPGAPAGDEERAARHRSRVRRTVWRGRAPPGTVVRVGRLHVRLHDGTVTLLGTR